MKEFWVIDYDKETIYPVMVDTVPLGDGYWYVNDDGGWYGTIGETIFDTRKAALEWYMTTSGNEWERLGRLLWKLSDELRKEEEKVDGNV